MHQFAGRTAEALVEPLRTELRRRVRRSMGVPADPPARAFEPTDAYMAPGGMARRVHGDLAAMVVGGVAALLLQTLHPLAMAGVADHSNYRDDPVGRLRRTADFIGATTYGTRDEAAAAIERVRTVHRRIHGHAPDGRPYNAFDPELVTWVHVAEVACFLAAGQRYGPTPLTRAECDRYLAEVAPVAYALGATDVPTTVDRVEAYFQDVQPELAAGPQAFDARDFLLAGASRRPRDRLAHAVVAAGAVSILPDWAREALELPPWHAGMAEHLVTAPVTRAFCAAVRWSVTPRR